MSEGERRTWKPMLEESMATAEQLFEEDDTSSPMAMAMASYL